MIQNLDSTIFISALILGGISAYFGFFPNDFSKLQKFIQTSFLPSRNQVLIVSTLLLLLGTGLFSTFIYQEFRQNTEPAVLGSSDLLPTVTLDFDEEPVIGETYNFEATFDNIATAPGFGPFFDIIMPTRGVDGDGIGPDDGIILNTATYLDAPLTIERFVFPEVDPLDLCSGIQTPVEHPYSVNNLNEPEIICGNPGDELNVIKLPFGSFVPEQPAATIQLTAFTSPLADAGTPLNIIARGGFQFGEDALMNPDVDETELGIWTSYQATPTVFFVTKEYLGPEEETVTGESFVRQYSLRAHIADGQTITNLQLMDMLPSNMAYVGIVSSTPAGMVVISEPSIGIPAASPNNELIVEFPSVTGTTDFIDAELVFEFFIPETNANNTVIIDPITGSPVIENNVLNASGMWTPIDPRDSAVILNGTASTSDHNITQKALAVQKSASNITNPGQLYRPGDVVEYTLNFQVSDYFALDNIQLTDRMSDGQNFDTTYTPFVQTTEQSVSTTFNIAPAYYSLTKDTGNPGSTGETTLIMNISDVYQDSGVVDSRLLGSCIQPTYAVNCNNPNGATTGFVRYRTVIQDSYTDYNGGGNNSFIDMGEVLYNGVVFNANLIDTNGTTTGNQISDDSAIELPIITGEVNKEIYAINGDIDYTTNNVGAGDIITYRIQYDLPFMDIEGFRLNDYLPLPALNSTSMTSTFSTVVDSAIPASGTSKFGPNDTLFNTLGDIPSVELNHGQNRISFVYNDITDTQNRAGVIDILFSIPIENQPFADGVNLINQIQATGSNTSTTQQVSNSIVPITLNTPNLNISKGVVASNNSVSTVLTPSTAGPVLFSGGTSACSLSDHRFTGTIDNSNLATSPINSDLTGADANDIITYAIVVQNTGILDKGAFDVRVADTLPVGMSIPSGGAGVCITDGAGNPLPSNPVNGAETNPLFQSGIELVDPSISQGALDDINGAAGSNILIITYNLQVSNTIQPNSTLINSARVLNYSALNNGTNFAQGMPIQDVASVNTLIPTISKTFIEGQQPHTLLRDVAIGEIVTYRVSATVPEGVTNNFEVVDTSSPGLAFVSATISSPGTITSSPTAISSVTPVVTANGSNILFDFGTVTNSSLTNTNNTITIDAQFVVTNVSSIQNTNLLNNSAFIRYDSQSATAVQTPNSATIEPIRVVEPELRVVKTNTASTGDASDTILYTLTVSHLGTSTSDAFGVNLEDIIPNGVSYVGGSLTHVSGTIPTTLSQAAGTITATWDTLTLGTQSVITFQGTVNQSAFPSQTIANTANINWSSLPGNITTTQSTFNPNGVERTGITTNTGGAANDHVATNTSNYVINSVTTTKSIVATSEAHTNAISGIERVIPGEIIRYRIATQIPESTITDLRIQDLLPTNLRYLNDGTTTLALVSNGGLTSSNTLLNSCAVIGSSSNISPTCVLDSGSILNDTGGTLFNADGTDPVFYMGNITNSDADANLEYIVIEMNAIVTNRTTNQAINNATGAITATTFANSARASQFNPITNSRQNFATSNIVTSQIAEPYLTINTVLSTTPTDANDPLQYTITVTNNNFNNTSATAFDINLTSVIDPNIDITSVSIASPLGGTTVTDNSNMASDSIAFLFNRMEPGQSIVLTVNGVARPNAVVGTPLPASFGVTYSSLPINGTLINPTGSVVPSGSQLTFERDGFGGLNDYISTSSATFTINNLFINKTLLGSETEFRIGDTATYRIVATPPEGIINNIVITDLLPAGLIYESHIVNAIPNGATNSTPTVNIVGQGVEFVFGNQTITGDNITTNDNYEIDIITRIADIASNQNGTLLTNDARIAITGTQNFTVTSANQPTVEVITPILNIDKLFLTDTLAPNDVAVAQLTITNTGNAPAYDVNVEDIVPAQFTNQIDGAITDCGFSPVISGGSITFNGGTITPGIPCILTLSFTLRSDLTHGTTYNNTATITTASTLPGTIANERLYSNINASDILNIVTPDLSITKTNNTSASNPGDTSTYIITVNNANYRSDGVVITETLSAHTSFNSTISTPGWVDIGGGQYTFTINTILAGGFQNVIFAVDIDDNLPTGITSLANTVTVTNDGSHGVDPTPLNNTFTDTDSLIAAPDLVVTKTNNTTVLDVDDSTTYTITVSNLGNQEAVNVNVVDHIPAHTQFDTASNSFVHTTTGGDYNNGFVTWTIPSVFPGDEYTFIITLNVNTTVPSGITNIINKVTVEDDGTNGADLNPSNNEALDQDTLEAAPDLVVNKTDGVISTTTSDVLVYQISIRNEGTQDAAGVVVTDDYDQTLGSVDNFGTGTDNGDTLVWTIPLIPAGSGLTLTYEFTVNSTVASGIEELINTVQVADDGSNGEDPTPTNNIAEDSNIFVAVPELGITKTDSATTTAAGNLITYAISYINNGNQEAQNIIITETVPAHTSFNQAGSTSGWSCSDGSLANTICTFSLTSLVAGDSGTIDFAVNVNSIIPAGITEISNTVTISDDTSNGIDPNLLNNTHTDINTLDAAPDISVQKSVDQAVAFPSDTLEYTITVTNNGTQDATGVVLTDTLPSYITLDSSSVPITSQVANVLTWNIGNLEVNQVITIILEVTVDDTLPSGVDNITNTVAAQDDGTNGQDTNLSNNTSDVDTEIVAAPELSIIISDNNVSVVPGQEYEYIIDIINSGVQNADNVVTTFTIPANTTLIPGDSSANIVCAGGYTAGNICTITIPELLTGESDQYTVSLLVANTLPSGVDTIILNATVNDDGTNGTELNTANNADSEPTPITAAPDYVITKSSITTSTTTGQLIQYTIEVGNIGNQNGVNVVVTDTIPDYSSLVSQSNGASIVGNQVSWTIGSLAVGQYQTFNIVVQTDATLPAGVEEIVNNVSVTDDGTNGSDTDTNNNTDSVTIPIIASPDLWVTKGVTPNSGQPGTNSIYTIYAQNLGNQTATNVVLTETVPLYSTYQASNSAPWSCADGSTSGTVCTLNIGSLDANEISANYAFSVIIDEPLPAGVDTISNTVSIADDGTNGPDQNLLNNSFTHIDSSIAAPDLVITKTDNNISYEPGEDVTYQLQARNIGDQDATGVIIIETVPLHTVYSANSSSIGWNCLDGAPSGSVCTYNVGNLDAQEILNIVFAVTPVSPFPAGIESITNNVVIEDDGLNGSDLNPSNNTASDTTSIIASPDLVVTKSDGITVLSHLQQTTYTIEVTNIGTQHASGVTVEDILPAEMVYVSSSPLATLIGGAHTWSGLSVAVGEVVTLQITAQMNIPNPAQPEVEVITNTVTVSDDGLGGPDLDLSNNSAEDSNDYDANPDYVITIDNGQTVSETGETLIYNINVQNVGNQIALGVTTTVLLPETVSFNPALSTPGWTCLAGVCTFINEAGMVFYNDLVLAVDVDTTMDVDTITLNAAVSYDRMDEEEPTPENNVASDTDTVVGTPDIEVVITDNRTQVAPGEAVTYEVTVTNNGDIITTGITTEAILDAIATINLMSDGGTNSGQTVTWSGLTLLPGGSYTYTIEVMLDEYVAYDDEEVISSASAFDDGTHGTELNLVDNESIDEDILDATPELVITTSIVEDNLYPGEEYNVIINYSNEGNQDSQDNIISFTIPANSTFDSSMYPDWTCNGENEGSICTFNLATLPAGSNNTGQFELVFTLIPEPNMLNPVEFNVAIENDTQINGNGDILTNNLDNDVSNIPEVNLVIIKSPRTTEGLVQSELIYDFVYRNLGPDAATNVVFEDILPADLDFVITTQNGLEIPTTQTVLPDGRKKLTFSVSSIPPTGQDYSLQVVTKIIRDSNAPIINTASIRSREADPEISNNVSTAASVRVIQPLAARVRLPQTGAETPIAIFLLAIGLPAAYLGIKSIRENKSNKKRN